MKKIFSALVLGALAAGIATADMSIGINYRNGIDVFKYVNKGMDGYTTDDYGNIYGPQAESDGIGDGFNNNGASYNLFNLTGWNSGKDTVTLKASGNIFSVQAGLQPTIASDSVIFHIFRIGAEVGNFYANAGWTGDGLMNYRVPRDANNSNEEGAVWESFKLGSPFVGSLDESANNQVGFGNPARNFFAYAGYSLVFNDKANMKVQASIISDREWDAPSKKVRGGNLGWALFLQPKVKKVFDAEVFVKSTKDAANDWNFIIGAYGKPLVTPLIADGGIGGSVWIDDGKLMEWNVDVRLLFEINENLTITSLNKFAKLSNTGNKADDDDDAAYDSVDGATLRTALGKQTAFKSSQILWNFLGVRYKINKTFAAIGAVGQVTDLDSGFQNGHWTGDGTQLFVHPHVQIYANPKISVCAGVLAAFGGIGADEGANKDVDLLINIPVLFRVKM